MHWHCLFLWSLTCRHFFPGLHNYLLIIFISYLRLCNPRSTLPFEYEMCCLKIKSALAHIYPSVVSGPLFAGKANQLAQLQLRSNPQTPTRNTQISTVSTQAHTSIQLWFLNIIQVGCLVRCARLHLSVCDVCLEVLIFCYSKKKKRRGGAGSDLCPLLFRTEGRWTLRGHSARSQNSGHTGESNRQFERRREKKEGEETWLRATEKQRWIILTHTQRFGPDQPER